MILDLEKLIEKYNLKIKGVIHIGAYCGGEYSIYKKLGIKNMVFYEPIPEVFKKLKKRVGKAAVNLALGNFNGTAQMYLSSNRMSSSLLEPHLHKTQYPQITFNEKIEVQVARLDDVLNSRKYNMINIDVQGYEKEVFLGATETLKNIDYIMTEVNRGEMYKGCVLIYELDIFLAMLGFKRVELDWAGGTWGDAFYMK